MQEIRSFIVHFLDPGEKFVETPQFNFKSFVKGIKKRQYVMIMAGPNVNSYQELEQLLQTCDPILVQQKTVIEY